MRKAAAATDFGTRGSRVTARSPAAREHRRRVGESGRYQVLWWLWPRPGATIGFARPDFLFTTVPHPDGGRRAPRRHRSSEYGAGRGLLHLRNSTARHRHRAERSEASHSKRSIVGYGVIWPSPSRSSNWISRAIARQRSRVSDYWVAAYPHDVV